MGNTRSNLNPTDKGEMTIDEVRKSEAMYRSIVETATNIIYKVDQDGRFTFVNQITEKVTGFSIIELMEMNYLDLVLEGYKPKVAYFYNDQIAKKTSSSYYEFPIHTKDGKEIWLGQNVQFTQNPHGTIEMISLAIDITDRLATEEKLLLEEEKYRNIIANMNLGLMEVDHNGIIQYANRSFYSMSGYTMGEVIGYKVEEVLHEEGEMEIINQTTDGKSDIISYLYTLCIRSKGGELKWWLVSSAPSYNDKGELTGSVGIYLDITVQKRLETELKQAKQKAEESSKSKEDFLATMSHEIRTPLNAIVGITELMKMDEKLRNEENLQILSFSAKNLLALITDILDISKIDAGKIEITQNPVDIRELLTGIYQIFRPTCEEKDVEFILNIEQTVPEVIKCDELRLSQIINNLVSNAVKFTHKGYIKISVSAQPLDPTKTRLFFKISDTGIGIKKSNLDKIFGAFEQANSDIVRQYGGTGLGLNITKKLIEMQGGEISLDSKLNKGSTFSFYIDFQISKIRKATPSIAAEGPSKKSDAFKNKTILLVEDNLVNQKVALSFFKHWGLECAVANNGAEALDMLAVSKYDLVLIDLFMPVMNGFDTIKQMQKDSELKKIPTIALTASAETNLMEKAIAMGARKCLTKPFNAEQLHDTLVNMLSDVKPQIPTAKLTTGKLPYSKIPLDLVDLHRIEDASLGSTDFIIQMIDLLYTQIPELMSQADKYYQNQKMKDFAETIHKVKYNILMLGMDSLKSDLAYLEENATKKTASKRLEAAYERIKTTCSKALLELGQIRDSFGYQD